MFFRLLLTMFLVATTLCQVSQANISVSDTSALTNSQDPLNKQPHSTFKQLYQAAVSAYYGKQFDNCLTLFNASLNKYHRYKRLLNSCAFKCHQKSLLKADETIFLAPFMVNLVNTQYSCLHLCKEQLFPMYSDNLQIADTVVRFESFEPYDFMQLCAFKVGIKFF